MVILDLFSGIGGFSEGFKRAGYNITKHYFSEIDKHAIACYKYNFKNSEYVGNVTSLDGRTIARPNIITFGSPCQDFSLAGKQAGMEGSRSSLIREAIRLITECKPDVFIWENVKGAFSSNHSEDFWGIIQAFANIGGYRLEWQLVNTAWLLPQNRERIYLIGHLGEGGGRNVFPITSNDKQNNDLQGQQCNTNTITARYYGAQATGSYVVNSKLNENGVTCVAQRGIGENNTQQLESRKDNVTNSLTSVQKDNLISITEHTDKFRFHKNDKKKSGVQGADIFKADCKVMDVIDNHPKNIIISHYGHKDKPPTESYISPTLKANSHGHEPMTNCNQRIRRLTEVECERLQGFKDGWTEYGDYDGVIKKIAKTQRYKMLGNAVTVDMVELIANRLDFRV